MKVIKAKRYWFYLLLINSILIFFSCSQQNNEKIEFVENTVKYEYNLNETEDVIGFAIDNNVVNRTTCLFPYYDSDSTLFLYYLYNNNIYVFDVDSERLKNKIALDFEGPNGVGEAKGFEVLSSDSILITSAFVPKLNIVDRKGNIISKIDYSNFSGIENIHSGITRSLANMRIGFKNGYIYLPFYPGYDKGNYKHIDPVDIRMIAKIDTDNKTISTLDIGFPKNYWSENYYPSFFGFFISNNQFHVNYMYNDLIMKSSNGKNWSAFKVPSKYAKIENNYERNNGVGTRYSRLIYDQYRGVYYRFVKHGQSIIEGRTRTDLVRYPRSVSIIILDKEMNIIGETLLPKDTYESDGYFISKGGLYVSLSNPFSSDYDVDKLVYRKLILKKNDE